MYAAAIRRVPIGSQGGVPPVANDDVAQAFAGAGSDFFFNVLENDAGNPPFSLISVNQASGGGLAVLSNNQVRFTAPAAADTTLVDYTVQDAGGLTDTGRLTITTNASMATLIPTIVGTPFEFASTTQGFGPYQFNYNHPGGANHSLLALVTLKKGVTNIGDLLGMAPTYGGQPVLEIVSSSPNGFGAAPTTRIFRLSGAPTGANPFSLTPACAQPIDSATIVLVSLVNDFGVGDFDSRISEQPPQAVSSATFDLTSTQDASLFLGKFGVRQAGQAIVRGAGHTVVQTGNSGGPSAFTDHSYLVQSRDVPTVATLPFSASWPTVENFSAAAVEILGSPGGGGLPSPPTASPDAANAVAGGPAIMLNVLTNDAGTGLLLTDAFITSGGGSIDGFTPAGDITFTPPLADGSTTIEYTVTNAGGSALGTLTITTTGATNVVSFPSGPTVQFPSGADVEFPS